MGRRADINSAAADLGYGELRPGQEEAVSALLDGTDTLAVMPTGSGKSAIYHLAGLLLEGPTIVVSPLLALQRDQVDAFASRGDAGAAELNSTLTGPQREETLEAVADEQLEFLLLAPEQLANEETLERLAASAPSLVVVDEAHCVSEWGHDFRPEYLRLAFAIDALGRPPTLALTATASPPVRAEIVERLALRRPAVIVRGFDRPNIWLGVEHFHDERPKLEAVVAATVEADKPGLVYVATRKRAEELAAALEDAGLRAAAYHAGLGARERTSVQDAFMADELDVVAATIAFGMGVDKPNVRFVFHAEISDSVDAYYQEIGRAGRDGAPARAVLFYRPDDLGLRRFFASGGVLKQDEVEQVLEAVVDADEPVDTHEVRAETGLSRSKTASALSRLEEAGAVDIDATGDVVATEDADADAVEAAVEAQQRRREFDRSRVEMMRGYAEVTQCRREYLLNYFGEDFAAPCGACDNCDDGVVVPEPGERPFGLGERVAHEAWGEGLVQRYEADKLVVLFDDAGYKTLSVDLVVEQELLRPV